MNVHIDQQDAHGQLSQHCSLARFAKRQVRGLAKAVGAGLSKRFQHDAVRIDVIDGVDGAIVVEHALMRLEGVPESSVSYAAERMRLEYNSQAVTLHRPTCGG